MNPIFLQQICFFLTYFTYYLMLTCVTSSQDAIIKFLIRKVYLKHNSILAYTVTISYVNIFYSMLYHIGKLYYLVKLI